MSLCDIIRVKRAASCCPGQNKDTCPAIKKSMCRYTVRTSYFWTNCHHKFSIWLIELFNINFLFSFQQRCKTVKLDFKPLQSGQTLTSTRKNWQMQVSTTEVLSVLFGKGAFTK